MPGLPFAAGRACAARGELWEILSRREKSSASASSCGEASETTMFGLGMGGACRRRGDDGWAVEGLGVEDEGWDGRSGLSRAAAVLHMAFTSEGAGGERE